ncbi:hypothetical protein BST61_g9533 [Cercospora zeina]
MASSFTARRPNASHLPAFELPPPPLTQKYHSGYSHVNSQHSPATTLTSVGNLLTPPSNGSVDGISPATSVPHSNAAVQSYTPSNSGGMWPPPPNNSTYGFQPSQPQHSYQGSTRSLFSPSLNSIIRGSNSPTAGEALPPPPPHYADMHHYPSSSVGMSQSTVPAPQQYTSMPVPAPVTQASPVHNQEAFARPPPTPTTSYYSQQSYSTGPSPVAQSPMSGGGLGKMSPVNQSGPVPPLHQSQYAQQYRPHSYPGMGGAAVLSGHSMGGVPGGMIPHFNSGHAAQMHHINHDLKRHKRIHLAVKPFPCGHCDKSFSRKDALKRHVLVKGCGKAGAASEVKELDGSISPKSESLENSPVVSATA